MDNFWQFVGPKNFKSKAGPAARSGSPVSGRVNAVAYDPVSPSTRYLGAADGGVWKTTDGGQTWWPLSDKWPYLYVSSIAIDPSQPQRLYVGTGDWPNQSGQSIGVMRSDDGGTKWVQALESGRIISCVAARIRTCRA